MIPSEGDAAFGYHLFYYKVTAYLGWSQFFLFLGFIVFTVGSILSVVSWAIEKNKWQNKIFP